MDTAAPLNRIQLLASDIVSFHRHGDLAVTRQSVEPLGRPAVRTEFMARGAGSMFEAVLPHFHAKGIGAYCWGLVRGKTQTHLPWDSWQRPSDGEPPVCFTTSSGPMAGRTVPRRWS